MDVDLLTPRASSRRRRQRPRAEPPPHRHRDVPALEVLGLGKCYRLYAQPRDRIRQWLWGWRRSYFQEHWALRDVSFTVARGQTVGIIGPNGSGKSTLLQVLAGTLTPTTGEARLAGRVAGLLELGSGFHPDFTGRENVHLYATILGLPTDDLEQRYGAIAEFSELGPALDRPLRTYSSGMIVRLAFSVAISVEPEILLVDEALAVGDLRFQMRCLSRLRELRERGVTLVLVTHDLEMCKRWCDQLFVLEQGRLVRSGPPAEVADWYFGRMVGASVETDLHRQLFEPPRGTAGWHRHGDGTGRIAAAELENLSGQAVTQARLGESYRLRLRLEFAADTPHPVVGFYIKDRCGTEVVGMNTHMAGVPLPAVRTGDRLGVAFELPVRVRPGVYSISAALAHDWREPRYLDWVDQAVVFEVVDPQPGRVVYGLVHEQITAQVSREE
jgi:lipopolysaccharide transport system ATP-binding protein